MYIKFDIKNEMLEWYKKHSIFAKWVIQNNSDVLVANYRKSKNKITQHQLILIHSL